MGAVAVGRGEAHPLPSHPIHAGGTQQGLPGTGHAPGIVLIGHDQENVRGLSLPGFVQHQSTFSATIAYSRQSSVKQVRKLLNHGEAHPWPQQRPPYVYHSSQARSSALGSEGIPTMPDVMHQGCERVLETGPGHAGGPGQKAPGSRFDPQDHVRPRHGNRPACARSDGSIARIRAGDWQRGFPPRSKRADVGLQRATEPGQPMYQGKSPFASITFQLGKKLA